MKQLRRAKSFSCYSTVELNEEMYYSYFTFNKMQGSRDFALFLQLVEVENPKIYPSKSVVWYFDSLATCYFRSFILKLEIFSDFYSVNVVNRTEPLRIR